MAIKLTSRYLNPPKGQPHGKAAHATDSEVLQHPALTAPHARGTGRGLRIRYAALRPDADPHLQEIAAEYNRKQGLKPPSHTEYVEVNIEEAKRLADLYEAAAHNPSDPAVKKAYAALAQEVRLQWDHAKDAGYVMEPWTREGQPYPSSKEMIDDVRRNHHLWFFQGGDMPEDHAMAMMDDEMGLTTNDMFRAIHDIYGHAKGGYQFGPRGEENAYRSHKEMFSDDAVPALRTETKAQNSWVNAGAHLRNPDGSVKKPGDPGFRHPTARPYADQKAHIAGHGEEGII